MAYYNYNNLSWDHDPNDDLTAGERLVNLMSGISEEYWFAGWLSNLQYDLWAMMCGDRDREYGFRDHFVTVEEIEMLKKLSNECGGWYMNSEESGFVNMNEWCKMYEPYQPHEL